MAEWSPCYLPQKSIFYPLSRFSTLNCVHFRAFLRSSKIGFSPAFLFVFAKRERVSVAGQIAFTSFSLHGSVGEQHDSYLALAFAGAEVEIFQLLASKIAAFLRLHALCYASKKVSF